MISIIIGSLNRRDKLEQVIENTIKKNNQLELVIVDGGSTDGTVDFINSLNSEQITFVEYGKRSSYSHFMNLGIKYSKYNYVCQWNTDAIMINNWKEIIKLLNENIDFYIFNWKIAKTINDLDSSEWINGVDLSNNWMLLDNSDTTNKKLFGIDGEVVMNYGIYNKKIFSKIGAYSRIFPFYFSDGDLSNRAYYFGYKHKSFENIKVLVQDSPKSRIPKKSQLLIYIFFLRFYKTCNYLLKKINLL